MNRQFLHLTTITAIRDFQLRREQRLLLYGTALLWFVAFVLSQRRNYQDSWILEGIVLPFVVLVALFIWVLSKEKDNRVVALLCSITLATLTMIPALKYQQPYGVAIDSVSHFRMVNFMLETGRVSPLNVYAPIASMHAWLTSLAILAGISAESAIKFGLPLLGTITPLLFYWLCQRGGLPCDLTKYTVSASCLAAIPYFHPNGSSFALVTLITILGLLIVRECYAPSEVIAFRYTIAALITIGQLILWHSTTPLVLLLILSVVAVATTLDWRLRRWESSRIMARTFFRFAVLTAVLYFGYHLSQGTRVFDVMQGHIQDLLFSETPPSSAIPKRLFEITPLDALQVTLVIRGRDFLLAGTVLLGLLVLIAYRRQLARALPLYNYFLLVLVSVGILVVGGVVSGLGYGRYLIVGTTVMPFFTGLFLWWFHQELLPRFPSSLPNLRRLAWMLLLILFVTVPVIQFFTYQPMVPKAKSLVPGAEDEYVVWLHGVNSSYQERMLRFAATRTERDDDFAMDIVSSRQYLRYFGTNALARRGPRLPLHHQEEIMSSNVSLFLLHWPGPAGGLAEQVEYRSKAKLEELRSTEGWNLIYDNGESFVLHLPTGERR